MLERVRLGELRTGAGKGPAVSRSNAGAGDVPLGVDA